MYRGISHEQLNQLNELESSFGRVKNHPYFVHTSLYRSNIKTFKRDEFTRRQDMTRAMNSFERKVTQASQEILEFEQKARESEYKTRKKFKNLRSSKKKKKHGALINLKHAFENEAVYASHEIKSDLDVGRDVVHGVDVFLLRLGEAVAFVGYFFAAPFLAIAKLSKNSSKPRPQKEPKEKRHYKPLHESLGFEWKAFAGFLVLAIVVSLPIQAIGVANDTKNSVVQSTWLAIDDLKSIELSSDPASIKKIQATFASAHSNFTQARAAIQNAGILADAVITFTPQGDTADSLLEIGTQLTLAAGDLTDALTSFTEGNILDLTSQDIVPDTIPFEGLSETSTHVQDSNLIVKMKGLKDSLQRIRPRIAYVNLLMSNVNDKYIPAQARSKWQEFQHIVPALQESTLQMVGLIDHLMVLFGSEQTRRSLVVFQNNTELRPTGGFIGSFALVDIDRGNIKHIEIPGGGSYSLQGQLTAQVESPKPLWLISPRWQFHDANWFPDFPSSAHKMSWFYEKSGGPTVDEVIALNASLVEKLLAFTGPIYLEEFDLTVTQDSFIDVIQQQVEVDYDREENQPKKILGALTPKLIEKLLETEPRQFLDVLSVLSSALVSRDIQFYSSHDNMQAWFTDSGWAGNIRQSPQDYLMVVDSNIAGGKSNKAIHQTVQHEAAIQADGSVINTVQITRTHNATPEQKFAYLRNISYLRVYVPQGSDLLSVDGALHPQDLIFKRSENLLDIDKELEAIEKSPLLDERSGTRISQEWDKTVFGNYLWLNPGESKTITYTYKLPITLAFNQTPVRYSLLIQKQSGMKPFEVTSTLRSSKNEMNPYWTKTSQGSLQQTPYTITLSDVADKDIFWGAVIGNEDN